MALNDTEINVRAHFDGEPWQDLTGDQKYRQIANLEQQHASAATRAMILASALNRIAAATGAQSSNAPTIAAAALNAADLVTHNISARPYVDVTRGTLFDMPSPEMIAAEIEPTAHWSDEIATEKFFAACDAYQALVAADKHLTTAYNYLKDRSPSAAAYLLTFETFKENVFTAIVEAQQPSRGAVWIEA